MGNILETISVNFEPILRSNLLVYGSFCKALYRLQPLHVCIYKENTYVIGASELISSVMSMESSILTMSVREEVNV